MAKGETLHPLQQKFLEHAALQCGICTPGVLVASKALLERNLEPTETEIRYWLAGQSLPLHRVRQDHQSGDGHCRGTEEG